MKVSRSVRDTYESIRPLYERLREKVDGILYPSRFTGDKCLALFGGKENLTVLESVPFQEHEEALALLDELVIALV